MKTIKSIFVLSLTLLLISGFAVEQKVQAQPGFQISFQTFYNELAPYGRWTNSRQYGSVWTPYAEQGFQPYSTNGYWAMTEYGNTWVSDYEWGWAPFHYGRWSFDDYLGWFWIPGYEWGPAWVNWRSGGDYYGWAPLGPGMNINVSINIPSFWWVFVPQRYITDRYWHRYSAPPRNVTQIYNHTTIINNYYTSNNRNYAYGPRREEIERVTRNTVPIRHIDNNQRGRVVVDRNYDPNPGRVRSNLDYPANRNTGVYNNNNRSQVDNSRSREVYSPQQQSQDRGRTENQPQSGRNDNNDRNRINTSPATIDRGYSAPQRDSRDNNRSAQPAAPSRSNDRGAADSRSNGPSNNRTSEAPAAPSSRGPR
jgi:hypothetical protein